MAMHPHLIDPVRVEHAQAAQLAARTLLCNTPQVPGWFQLRDALVHWLTVHDALRRATSGQHRCIQQVPQPSRLCVVRRQGLHIDATKWPLKTFQACGVVG